jgi:hypothetical protein
VPPRPWNRRSVIGGREQVDQRDLGAYSSQFDVRKPPSLLLSE